MTLEIRDTPSPHHDSRREGTRIASIVLHYTGTSTAQEAAEVYLGQRADPAGRISPHYMIDTDGTIFRFVDEACRAWHAGKSFWRGERDINSVSVGIEIVNAGIEGGCPPYAPEQIATLAALCREIMERHGLPPDAVLGHSDIAPGRKDDPGPHLDWGALAAQGVGVWPEESAEGAENLSAALVAYGYDPDVSDTELERAFALHFCPEALSGDEEAKAALRRRAAALSRLKERF